MRSVWVAGAYRDCLLSARDAELLVSGLRGLPPGHYPQEPAVASLLEHALEGGRDEAAIRIDAGEWAAVVDVLDDLAGERGGLSEGLGELLEILLAETPGTTRTS